MGLLVWIFWCDGEEGAGVEGAKAEEVLVGFFTVGQVGSALALSRSLSLSLSLSLSFHGIPWRLVLSILL